MKHRINILLYSTSLVLISLFLNQHKYFILFLLAASLVFVLIVCLGVVFIRLNYFLPSISKLSNDKCLLTFDDGPDPHFTPIILDILKEHQVSAIFFLVGDKVEKEPELVKRIVSEGHLIGNHSQSHNNLMSLFNADRLRTEIQSAQKTIESISGIKNVLFRPPIGYTNPKYARILKELKLKCIGWTLRSYDSVYKTSSELNKRLLKFVRPGSIVLLHDNLKVTTEALNEFIVEAKANGIIFATSKDIKTILND